MRPGVMSTPKALSSAHSRSCTQKRRRHLLGGLALGPTHHSVKDAGINATALARTWAVTQSGKAIAGKGLKMLRTECTISIGSAAC